MEMMLELAMGVMDMEDDKVADMVLIPNEDFSDGTVAICDTYRDDVRGNDVGSGHGGGATRWLNIQLMQVAPPDGYIYN